jgi:hypothetical protein
MTTQKGNTCSFEPRFHAQLFAALKDAEIESQHERDEGDEPAVRNCGVINHRSRSYPYSLYRGFLVSKAHESDARSRRRKGMIEVR